MSGVYIKGMEMPKTWRDCCFSNGAAECKLQGYIICGMQSTVHPCPLIPVPEHGRLIDESDVLNVLEPVHKEEKAAIAWKHIYANEKYLLSKVPTIIPASEEVYAKGYDTAGNYHWIGTQTGEHIIPADTEGGKL